MKLAQTMARKGQEARHVTGHFAPWKMDLRYLENYGQPRVLGLGEVTGLTVVYFTGHDSDAATASVDILIPDETNGNDEYFQEMAGLRAVPTGVRVWAWRGTFSELRHTRGLFSAAASIRLLEHARKQWLRERRRSVAKLEHLLPTNLCASFFGLGSVKMIKPDKLWIMSSLAERYLANAEMWRRHALEIGEEDPLDGF